MKKRILLFCLGVLLFIPFSAKAIVTNPLKHLEVRTSGGEGNFDLSTGKKVFGFHLNSEGTKAHIIAEATNDSYTIEGAGDVECEDGLNKIEVVVTDPADNTSVVYTINLDFKHYDSLEDKPTDVDGNPATGAFLNIALLGSLSVGSYILIKKSYKKKLYNI